MDIAKLILSLPFKTRNADEFMDENILNLFVDPTDGVAGPFIRKLDMNFDYLFRSSYMPV